MNPENPASQSAPSTPAPQNFGIPQQQVTSPTPPPEEPKKHKFPKLLLTIVLILAALFIAAYAGAYIFMQEELNKILGVAKPTPTLAPTLVEPSPTPDPIANWQTFTDLQLGYSIKYPPEFGNEKCPKEFDHKTLCSDAIDDNPVEPYYYFIGFSPNNPVESAPGLDNITYQKDQINGIEVERTYDLPSRSGAEYVYFKKDDGSHIEIFFTGYDETDPFPEQEKYKKLFDQILTTFTFLDSTTSISPSQSQVACTADAKICPDGSAVSRVGPNCEFAVCPGE